jgi:hypothetical protein
VPVARRPTRPLRRQRRPALAQVPVAHAAPRHVFLAPSCWSSPSSPRPSSPSRWRRRRWCWADRAVAELPGRLRRHGLAGADDGGRHRRLRGRGARHQQQPRDQPGLAVVGGGAVACSSRWLCSTLIGWLSVRTEGIYTIMITLAIGVAFYYLVLQNYSVFNGFQGLREAEAAERSSASTGATRCRSTSCRCSARWRLLPGALHRARARSASRCRASATTRGAWRRWASTWSRTGSPPMRSRADRRRRRRAAGLVQRLMTPGSVGTGWLINILVIAVLGGVQAPDRRLPRRDRLRAAADLRDRPDRPRTLQPRDRRRVPRHRAVFPRRPARTVGEASLPLRPEPGLDFNHKGDNRERERSDSGSVRCWVRRGCRRDGQCLGAGARR